MLYPKNTNNNSTSVFFLMEEGGTNMKKFVALEAVSESLNDVRALETNLRVYDFSTTQIEKDGKTITICFPDEGKPLE